MSVANLVIARDGIRIVSDTIAYAGKEPVMFHRKVTALPAMQGAITVRGPSWIGGGMGALGERWTSLDQAVDEASRVMPTLPILARERGALGGSFEVTIAAWSDGPRVVRLVWDDERQELDRFDLTPGVYLAPTLGPQQWPEPETITDDQLVRLALVQQTLTRKHGLNMCVGGDVELTRITADGVTIETLAEYPDREMTARRMATQPGEMAARAVA